MFKINWLLAKDTNPTMNNIILIIKKHKMMLKKYNIIIS